eukprot:2120257-Pleurochrysis_carterae.AAC.1
MRTFVNAREQAREQALARMHVSSRACACLTRPCPARKRGVPRAQVRQKALELRAPSVVVGGVDGAFACEEQLDSFNVAESRALAEFARVALSAEVERRARSQQKLGHLHAHAEVRECACARRWEWVGEQ